MLGKEGEVFNQIEQAAAVAGTVQYHLQRYTARLVLALDEFYSKNPSQSDVSERSSRWTSGQILSNPSLTT